MANQSDRNTQPVQSPENALLEAFIGKWRTTGKVAAGPDSPGMTVTATDTYEWLPGGFSVIHYAEGIIGDDKIHSIEIIGYDSLRKAYFAPFFSNDGNTIEAVTKNQTTVRTGSYGWM